MLFKLKYDPRLLDPKRLLPIPLDIHMPLKEVGLTDQEEMLCRGRQHQQRVLIASELCMKFENIPKRGTWLPPTD
jgi:hypothetical protein